MVSVQALTPVHASAARVELFAPVCQANPYGAIQSPGELVDGCLLFEYRHNRQAAIIALSFQPYSGGSRVHINALQTLNPATHLQTRQLMQAIEHTASMLGADVLTLSTKHPAIAAGASRWGGHISGAIVSKYLGVH